MTSTSPELKNIQAIVGLERETRSHRSVVERITDRISALAGSPVFIVAHLLWFAIWIGINGLRSVAFDAYPFNLLTLAVSLEAIVLTGCVLMAQNRMTQQAHKHAHLDLQINLLAEQELTAILRVVSLIAERAGIDLAAADPRLAELCKRIDVRSLAATLNTALDAIDPADTRAAPPASS